MLHDRVKKGDETKTATRVSHHHHHQQCQTQSGRLWLIGSRPACVIFHDHHIRLTKINRNVLFPRPFLYACKNLCLNYIWWPKKVALQSPPLPIYTYTRRIRTVMYDSRPQLILPRVLCATALSVHFWKQENTGPEDQREPSSCAWAIIEFS